MGPEAQIIATAMQQYGLILADIGSAMYVTGTSASENSSNDIDLTWDMDDVLGLHALTAGDFQVVNLTPVVTGLSASSGPAGSTITINGQNFSGAAGNLSVFFGTAAATSVSYVSDSQITAVVPSGSGTVNVTVQSGVNETDPNNPNDNVNAPIFGYGTSAVSTADQFTFSSQTVSAGNSSASFASSIVTAGVTDTLTIAVEDSSGNPIGGLASSAFQFNLAGGTSAGTFGTVTQTATPGTYTATFSATTAGTASTLTATVNGVALAARPTITVAAPAEVSALYVKGTGWTTTFDNELASTGLGSSGTPSLGYALQTGANQSKILPWVNVNVIEATFTTAVNVSQNSLVLTGGTGGSTPSLTGFSSLGGNTYAWTLSSSLTANRLEISFLATGAHAVTDLRGAGLSGNWTSGTSSFPSGNGLAGTSSTSDFNFLFNALPGDAARNGSVVNSTDYLDVKGKVNQNTSSANYTPYYDVLGAGSINSTDYLDVKARVNNSLPSGAPGPQNTGVGGLSTNDDLSSLALAVLDASSTATGPAPTALANLNSSGSTSSAAGSRTGNSNDSGDLSDGPTGAVASSDALAFDTPQANDEALSDFDPADLYV